MHAITIKEFIFGQVLASLITKNDKEYSLDDRQLCIKAMRTTKIAMEFIQRENKEP